MMHSVDAFTSASRYSEKKVNYFKIYDQHLYRFLSLPNLVIVEIGVQHGGSLQMWRKLFGKDVRIIGVDVNPNAKKLEVEDFEIFIANQDSIVEMEDVFSKIGNFDILIDDGAHTNIAQRNTFEVALKRMNQGGIILVEDLQSSYLSEFGNPSSRSFAEVIKSITDIILNPAENCIINKLSIYDSIACFENIPALLTNNYDISNNGIKTHENRALLTLSRFEKLFSHILYKFPNNKGLKPVRNVLLGLYKIASLIAKH